MDVGCWIGCWGRRGERNKKEPIDGCCLLNLRGELRITQINDLSLYKCHTILHN